MKGIHCKVGMRVRVDDSISDLQGQHGEVTALVPTALGAPPTWAMVRIDGDPDPWRFEVERLSLAEDGR